MAQTTGRSEVISARGRLRRRRVVVVGLGHVGLTLSCALAAAGHEVVGVDIDEEHLRRLRAGAAAVGPLQDEVLAALGAGGLELASSVPHAEVYVITVQTPAAEPGAGRSHLAPLEAAADAVGRRLRPGDLAVVRSTVAVGTTREVVLPSLLRASGLADGEIRVVVAPERGLEGRMSEELRTLPQLVGGLDPASVDAARALFAGLVPEVVDVGSLEGAELAKLACNAQRDVMFAFANEMALVASAFGVDAAAVAEAASLHYPRAAIPRPSPGVGGPCLTKDPLLLADAARRAGLPVTTFEHARRVNDHMPQVVVEAILGGIVALGLAPGDSSVLVHGAAFKGQAGVSDLRGSPGVAIAQSLAGEVKEVVVTDPEADDLALLAADLVPVSQAASRRFDAVAIVTDHPAHRAMTPATLARQLAPPALVFDGWGLLDVDEVHAAGIDLYLGMGFSRVRPGSSVQTPTGPWHR